MIFLNSFLIGGIICALVQILLDKTKLLPGRVMVLLVVIGTILGFFGLYQPLIDWAGAGASVPLIGFGNNLWKGMAEHIDKDGLIGIFEGGFTASAIGISAALIEINIFMIYLMYKKHKINVYFIKKNVNKLTNRLIK